MVDLKAVQASNARIAATFPAGLVAVFVGATAGIGEFSLLEFARCAPKSRIYFVGRSEQAGARIKAEVEKLNPEGSCTFIKADVSEMKKVDAVSREIKEKESSVNLLFQTQGTLDFFKETSEGLRTIVALLFYSRTRFMLNLLPELRAGSSTFARSVTVATGGKEGPLDPADFELKKVSLSKARTVGASMVTMGLEVLQQKAPEVTFIHGFPGPVKTQIDRSFPWWLAPVKYPLRLVMSFTAISAKETGERHTFMATSARWPAKGADVAEKKQGVELGDGVVVAKGTDGKDGSGVYSVDERDDSAGPSVVKVLTQYREDGTTEKFWKFVEDKYTEITGSVSL